MIIELSERGVVAKETRAVLVGDSPLPEVMTRGDGYS